MAKLNENEIKERNANIVARYLALTESQPLATANKIIAYIANEYQLTPQNVGRIIRESGVDTTTKPLQEVLAQ